MRGLTKLQFDRIKRMLKKDNALTARGILAEAAKENSPLHGLFEWDDTKAAHEYRLIQARRVAKRFNILESDPAEKLVHVPAVIAHPGDSREGEYRPVGVIVTQLSEFERALSNAVDRLHAAQTEVKLLEQIANEQEDDRAATLGALLKSLEVTTEALQRLH